MAGQWSARALKQGGRATFVTIEAQGSRGRVFVEIVSFDVDMSRWREGDEVVCSGAISMRKMGDGKWVPSLVLSSCTGADHDRREAQSDHQEADDDNIPF